MPILLVFAITAACVPVKWWPPLMGGGAGTAIGFTASAVFLSLGCAFALRSWVVRGLLEEPMRKPEIIGRYSQFRRILFYLNIGLVALCVLVFGWGWFVREHFVIPGRIDPLHGGPLLAPFAELAVPLPYFAILLGIWLIYFDAELALHRTTVLGPTERTFWTRAGYVLQHLRQFALLVMLPVMLFVSQQTAVRFAPETTQSDWYRLGSIAVVPLLILFMPLLIKPLLGLKTMPPGPFRDRLERISQRLHFRCTDFLLWPTHGAAANAMIVGLLPRIRYVIFTDRILEDLPEEELDAVFGHEVGHAKHGHIWLYAVFLILSMTVLAAVLLLLGNELQAAQVEFPAWVEEWLILFPVLLVASYVFLVFGYLSRRCERQADVYGCRAVSCGDPNCHGHDARTIYPERARGLCPTGIRTFVRALERVGLVNESSGSETRRGAVISALAGIVAWLRAWQHSTMPRRIDFLLGLIDDRTKERRFQRSIFLLRWGLIGGLLVALLVIGQLVGWRELLQAM